MDECFHHLRLGTLKPLNYWRTRQFVGTDKLVSNYRDAHFNSGGTILLTLSLTTREGSKLQISAELHRLKERADSPKCATTCGEGQDNCTVIQLQREPSEEWLRRNSIKIK